VIHFQRSRTTWNFEKGDRIRLMCEDLPSWHKHGTHTVSFNKVTCQNCMKVLLKKRWLEMNLASEKCGINLEDIIK